MTLTPAPNARRGGPRFRRGGPRFRAAAALLSVAVAAAAACTTTDQDEPPAQPEPTGAGVLAGICPDPIVIQWGWWPEAEHGSTYQLLGEDYTIDADAKKVTGPLVAGGEDTGVDIEIRAGGGAVGFQLPSAVLYTDDSITFAMVDTDEAIAVSAETPVLSVLAPLDVIPLMIMWDAEAHPEFNTVVDIGESDTTVLYFDGATYMEYLVGSGVLRADQIDGSYDGSPARWVTENGMIAQQGFATSEPFLYEHDLPDWGRPVKFQLIHNLGYEVYPAALSIRAEQKDELADCMQRLVPILQQAQVDYIQDPGPTNELIVETAEAYDSGWIYSTEHAEFSATEQLRLEIVSNGDDETLGNFDPDRVTEVIDIIEPIYAAQRRNIKEGLTADDIVTNEFIDPGIGLP